MCDNSKSKPEETTIEAIIANAVSGEGINDVVNITLQNGRISQMIEAKGTKELQSEMKIG